MKLSPWIATALITATAATAAAAPPGNDSPTLADRTLWLPARTTEVSTAAELKTDEHSLLDLDARYSLGAVEPFLGLSIGHDGQGPWPERVDALRGGVRVPIATWAALRITGRRLRPPWYDLTATLLDAAIEARVPLWAHQAALRAIAGGGLYHEALQNFFVPDVGVTTVTTDEAYGFADLAAILQSTASVALEVGARIDVGPWYFTPTYRRLGPYGTLLFAFERVDLFARVTFDDVTASVDPSIGIGAAARF